MEKLPKWNKKTQMSECKFGKIAKYDSKLDFKHKHIPQIQSNAKVTQKDSENLQQPPYEQTKNMY